MTQQSSQSAMAATQQGRTRVDPQTHPARYKHWQLDVEGAVATLRMNVREDGGLNPGYQLKLNSYDLGVDIELSDAVTRLRFEHPGVGVVLITSAQERIFCAGANIFMLRGSSHPFKVNFCKYTNETRLAMEEASAESGQRYIAALNGLASGGGYELALACDEIHLIDDRSSAVSLPEVPYLGVLPGTGGLTRVVDKRKVRRDLADIFSTLAEGVRGKRAVEWGLVDAVHPPSQWGEAMANIAAGANAESSGGEGVTLEPLEKTVNDAGLHYRHVDVRIDAARRIAELTLRGPEADESAIEDPVRAGCQWYPLALFRELDDALVELRFNYEEVGLIVLRTTGDMDALLAAEARLLAAKDTWFGRETLLFIRRTLKRLEMTARSIFALVEGGSCFGGMLLETALASDRIYMLDDPENPVEIAVTEINGGMVPMGNGLGRLAQRFLANPEHAAGLMARAAQAPLRLDAPSAMAEGLVTAAPDDLDWEDEVRIAIEERASLSPDALTGMEANLRFAGPETMETKIFGRLSAWQNWIFQRPNATGEKGALSLYGEPESPQFDNRRT